MLYLKIISKYFFTLLVIKLRITDRTISLRQLLRFHPHFYLPCLVVISFYKEASCMVGTQFDISLQIICILKDVCTQIKRETKNKQKRRTKSVKNETRINVQLRRKWALQVSLIRNQPISLEESQRRLWRPRKGLFLHFL